MSVSEPVAVIDSFEAFTAGVTDELFFGCIEHVMLVVIYLLCYNIACSYLN